MWILQTALFFTVAIIGAVKGSNAAIDKQIRTQQTRCHCACAAIGYIDPFIRGIDLRLSAVAPEMRIAKRNVWMGGSIVCVPPGTPDSGQTFDRLERERDRIVSSVREELP